MKISEVFDLDGKIKGNLYFCSDLHYNHANVIRFGNRNFDTVEEMNDSITRELMSKLKPDDILFTLGDDFWRVREADIAKYIDALPTKNLYKIMGNHDKYGYYWCGKLKDKYKMLADLIDIQVKYKGKTYFVNLSHYPIYDFNKMYHGGIHLFGHVHGNLDSELYKNPRLMVDVGYDGMLAKSIGSFLISFKDIIEFFDRKTGGLDYDTWGRRNYSSTVDGYGEEGQEG